MTIVSMGKFTAIGMRTKVEDPTALVVNTCSGNDSTDRGDKTRWTWSNPTNRAIGRIPLGTDPTRFAVSTECAWQGAKILKGMTHPDPRTLGGEWRRGKAKKPIGTWNGEGKPLITTPGEARRKVYIPAFRASAEHWLQDPQVLAIIDNARHHPGPVFLRDHDTGRGIDRNGPMSHAWVLAMWLNTGKWPS